MRFHLVDKVTEICYDKYIVGVKCITLADDVFNEHFPGHPIFPGSLIMEGMAQLAGSFFEITMNERKITMKRSVLTIVNHLKFKRPAYPGDRLIYRADIKSFRIDEFGVAKVTASMDGELYAEAEMLFSFFDIPSEKLEASRKELYDICLKYAKVIE
jgi:3-hydroxyacyl-[acyl-carrier-protein] dehydratase